MSTDSTPRRFARWVAELQTPATSACMVLAGVLGAATRNWWITGTALVVALASDFDHGWRRSRARAK